MRTLCARVAVICAVAVVPLTLSPSAAAARVPSPTARAAAASHTIRSTRRAVRIERKAVKRCRQRHSGHCSKQRRVLRLARRRLARVRESFAQFIRASAAANAKVPTIAASSSEPQSQSAGVAEATDPQSATTNSREGNASPKAMSAPAGSSNEPASGGGSQPEASGETPAESSSGSTTAEAEATAHFGTFVKGIDTNLEGWGSEAGEAMSEMHMLGVNWAREDIQWSEVEPQKGVYHWSVIEKTFAAAKADGITVLPVIARVWIIVSTVTEPEPLYCWPVN